MGPPAASTNGYPPAAAGGGGTPSERRSTELMVEQVHTALAVTSTVIFVFGPGPRVLGWGSVLWRGWLGCCARQGDEVILGRRFFWVVLVVHVWRDLVSLVVLESTW